MPCFRLAEELAVLWDGTVSACCYDADATMKMGDVRKDSLRSIWTDKPLQTLRSHHASGDLHSFALCNRCEVVNRVFSL